MRVFNRRRDLGQGVLVHSASPAASRARAASASIRPASSRMGIEMLRVTCKVAEVGDGRPASNGALTQPIQIGRGERRYATPVDVRQRRPAGQSVGSSTASGSTVRATNSTPAGLKWTPCQAPANPSSVSP